jgi:hypothetical protein
VVSVAVGLRMHSTALLVLNPEPESCHCTRLSKCVKIER